MAWIRIFAAACLALALPVIASAADIQGRHILLPAKERQVSVTRFRAPGAAPRPSVLLLHGANGFDSQITNYDRYAAELAARGMDTYLVYYYSPDDQRQMMGGSDVFMARYPAWAKLVDDLAEDLLAEPSSNGKIGLIGFSNGATLASGAGALDPRITAAVSYYGALPFPIMDEVKRLPPLLILHGDDDTIIPLSQGQALVAFAHNLGGSAEIVVYPGAKHGFGSHLDTKDGADAEARATQFMAKALDAHPF